MYRIKVYISNLDYFCLEVDDRDNPSRYQNIALEPRIVPKVINLLQAAWDKKCAPIAEIRSDAQKNRIKVYISNLDYFCLEVDEPENPSKIQKIALEPRIVLKVIKLLQAWWDKHGHPTDLDPDLQPDLIDYLRSEAPKVLDFQEAQNLYGCALYLIPLEELWVKNLEVNPTFGPFADDNPNIGSGYYAVPAVNLVRGKPDYPWGGSAYSFVWLPTERRYGTFEMEHDDLMVFRSDVTWSVIVADIKKYFQATNNGGDVDESLAEYFCPWPKYPYVQLE